MIIIDRKNKKLKSLNLKVKIGIAIIKLSEIVNKNVAASCPKCKILVLQLIILVSFNKK
jgi:hypothetical protein